MLLMASNACHIARVREPSPDIVLPWDRFSLRAVANDLSQKPALDGLLSLSLSVFPSIVHVREVSY